MEFCLLQVIPDQGLRRWRLAGGFSNISARQKTAGGTTAALSFKPLQKSRGSGGAS